MRMKMLWTAVPLFIVVVFGVLSGCSFLFGTPEAYIAASASYGSPPLAVEFDGSGSDGRGGTIEEYEWDFGDGVHAIGMTASHVFQSAGDYPVTLSILDSRGRKGATRTFVHVRDPHAVEGQTDSAGIATFALPTGETTAVKAIDSQTGAAVEGVKGLLVANEERGVCLLLDPSGEYIPALTNVGASVPNPGCNSQRYDGRSSTPKLATFLTEIGLIVSAQITGSKPQNITTESLDGSLLAQFVRTFCVYLYTSRIGDMFGLKESIPGPVDLACACVTYALGVPLIVDVAIMAAELGLGLQYDVWKDQYVSRGYSEDDEVDVYGISPLLTDLPGTQAAVLLRIVVPRTQPASQGPVPNAIISCKWDDTPAVDGEHLRVGMEAYLGAGGSVSSDYALTDFNWSILASPPGSRPTLLKADYEATFKADFPGVYIVGLTVITDSGVQSLPADESRVRLFVFPLRPPAIGDAHLPTSLAHSPQGTELHIQYLGYDCLSPYHIPDASVDLWFTYDFVSPSGNVDSYLAGTYEDTVLWTPGYDLTLDDSDFDVYGNYYLNLHLDAEIAFDVRNHEGDLVRTINVTDSAESIRILVSNPPRIDGCFAGPGDLNVEFEYRMPDGERGLISESLDLEMELDLDYASATGVSGTWILAIRATPDYLAPYAGLLGAEESIQGLYDAGTRRLTVQKSIPRRVIEEQIEGEAWSFTVQGELSLKLTLSEDGQALDGHGSGRLEWTARNLESGEKVDCTADFKISSVLLTLQ